MDNNRVRDVFSVCFHRVHGSVGSNFGAVQSNHKMEFDHFLRIDNSFMLQRFPKAGRKKKPCSPFPSISTGS